MDLDKAVLSLRHAASTDETRQNLSGIYLDNGVAVATSGFILAAIATEPSDLTPCILSATDAAAIEKALPKKARYGESIEAVVNVPEANLNGHLPVTIGTTEMKPAKVVAEFPDYSKVVPQGDVKFSATFNADLLNDLVAIVRAADQDGKKRAVIRLEFFEDTSCVGPIRVTASSAPRFVGLLMPCRA